MTKWKVKRIVELVEMLALKMKMIFLLVRANGDHAEDIAQLCAQGYECLTQLQ